MGSNGQSGMREGATCLIHVDEVAAPAPLWCDVCYLFLYFRLTFCSFGIADTRAYVSE
jgi:hypothetical protein